MQSYDTDRTCTLIDTGTLGERHIHTRKDTCTHTNTHTYQCLRRKSVKVPVEKPVLGEESGGRPWSVVGGGTPHQGNTTPPANMVVCTSHNRPYTYTSSRSDRDRASTLFCINIYILIVWVLILWDVDLKAANSFRPVHYMTLYNAVLYHIILHIGYYITLHYIPDIILHNP